MQPNPEQNTLSHSEARRAFLQHAGIGLGGIALASMFSKESTAEHANTPAGPLAPRPGHFAPKAKSVIYLFMAGGPSQLELFDDKPALRELDGQKTPESFTQGKRFAFLKSDTKLLGTRRKFSQHGQSGMQVSELLPHIAGIVDELCWLKGMKTDVFNHGPAKVFMNTGSPQFGRPSMGSWVTYGLGSECDNLPAFCVLQSGPRGPRGGAALWSSGFLPTVHQGVPFLKGANPILDLAPPQGIDSAGQSEFVDTVRDLNKLRRDATGDPEIDTRIAAYEMAYRMQASAPDLVNLSQESEATLKAYGVQPGVPSFSANCLLARRLIERGVRFVQLYHTDWDHHGDPLDLGKPLENVCREVDQASAALVRDLKERGLLNDTLVVWGGEFGRTPMGEARAGVGRDHHVDAFTMWLAGGGVRPGLIHGRTDDIGYNVVENMVHVHDLQATILHQLGLDHERLTFRFQGRDFRLTDVHGRVVREILV